MTDAERQDKNAALAKLLGWSVKPYTDGWWRLYQPDGAVFYRYGKTGSLMVVEAEGWTCAPNYYGSVDAVLAELPEDWDVDFQQNMEKDYREWNPEIYGMDWVLKRVYMVCISPSHDYWLGYGSTRAEALAAALLLCVEAGGLQKREVKP